MKYLLGSTIGALVMLGLSYTWHGILLNDFEQLPVPLYFFLSLLFLVYLSISVAITFLFSHFYDFFSNGFKRFFVGASFGFFLYLVAFTLNVSLIHDQMKHVVIDFSWQMFEQAFGAVMIGVVVTLSKRAKAFSTH